MDQQSGAGMALQLTQTGWCVVRACYDGSGLYMAYGPCATQADASLLVAALREVGVQGDALEIVPFHGVSAAVSRDNVPTTPDAPTED